MESNRGLVSVLMCTYNAQDFLDQTVKSLVRQTYPNIEILIRDDASTDNTIQLLKERVSVDSRISFFSGEKKGPYVGLNFLMGKAQGEYFVIQDHDDPSHPEKIQKQIQCIERTTYLGCSTRKINFYETDNVFIQERNQNPGHTGLLFKKGTYRYVEDKEMFQDESFLQSIGKQNITVVPEFLTLHRFKTNKSNLSSQRTKNKSLLWRMYKNNDIVLGKMIYYVSIGLFSGIYNFKKKYIDPYIFSRLHKVPLSEYPDIYSLFCFDVKKSTKI